MKISGRKPIQPASPLGGKAETPQVEQAEEAKPADRSDSLNLSDTSKNLMSAREKVNALPDVRVERVSEIKSALDDGGYHVESEKIAKKIVDESLSESLRGKKR